MSCPDEWADMKRRGGPEDTLFFQFLMGQQWADSDRVSELDRQRTNLVTIGWEDLHLHFFETYTWSMIQDQNEGPTFGGCQP